MNRRARIRRRTLDPYLAGHEFDELPSYGQPEPGTAMAAVHRPVELNEGLEYDAVLVRWNTNAGIGNRELEKRVAAGVCRVERDRQNDLTCIGELRRVIEKVAQHLGESRRLTEHLLGHFGFDVAAAVSASRTSWRRSNGVTSISS